MRINFFNLNTEHGRFLPKIIDFIKRKKFDIFSFQEVTGGFLSKHRADDYGHYKKQFKKYHPLVALHWDNKTERKSYSGNATFAIKDFKPINTRLVWLNRTQKKFVPLRDPWEIKPICLLSTLLKAGDKEFYIINAHLAWGPDPIERPYKRKQNKKLIRYIRELKKPFILSGDFNLTPEAWTVREMSKLGLNLTQKYQIKNTLNLRLHRAKKELPARGLAVDYIFVSKHFKIKNFQLVTKPALSDHYGLSVVLEI